MIVKKTILEIITFITNDDVVFNMVFLDTGEIRQKRRSKKWVMERIFYHELRTQKKNRGEIIEYDGEV